MKQQLKEQDSIDAWITTYALTGGIFKVRAQVCSDTMISYKQCGGRHMDYAHGKNWYPTEAAAIARAEEMRANKLKSIDKQVAKLKALKFEVAK